MSDIGLNLDGVIALLAAGVLCLLLLIALAVCSLFTWPPARRLAAVPHLVGILCSLAGSVVVLIAVVVTAIQSEGNLETNRVGVWLDRWLLHSGCPRCWRCGRLARSSTGDANALRERRRGM